jgi:hypothetical protein
LDWRTPQANEAGAKVETLYTKDGQPARPGQRAYRRTPSGKLVLQSQTINQQVEMVSRQESSVNPAQWHTPESHERTHSPRKCGHGTIPLANQVMAAWATPRSCSAMAATITPEAANDPKRFPNLETQVGKAWATPRVKGEEKGETRLARGKDLGLHGQTGSMTNGAKLNPRWVETLMGLPVGWTMPSCACPATIAPTSSGFSATELFPQQQNEPFGCWQPAYNDE